MTHDSITVHSSSPSARRRSRHRVDDWIERGVVHVWNHGFDGGDDHPRYVGSAGMNSIAKDLAAGLDGRDVDDGVHRSGGIG